MKKVIYFIFSALLVSYVLLSPSKADDPKYKWTLTDPNGGQLNAYRVGTGIVTVASVHTVNGCQTPYLVPARKMPFLYDLKIRTLMGPILCTNIVKDRLVPTYERGAASVVHVRTLSGMVILKVEAIPTTPPSP
jgi:hypothetical protein